MANLESYKPSIKWSFASVKRRETLYATHGYHRYPSKFIPQLVRKAIIKYSAPGDVVLDPFGGCGTTLVEAKLSGRNSIGIDVNRVAVLISRVKVKSIDPELLEAENEQLLGRINSSSDGRDYFKSANARLRYWFKREQYNKLAVIFKHIQSVRNRDVQLFYECCFSNILKNCSIWLAKSIKPQRDLTKKEDEPVSTFARHLKFMTAKNREFTKLLSANGSNGHSCRVVKGDARNLDVGSNSVDLIVTSPPYVTSYEYAELHQLSTLWFGFTDEIGKIKKGFIGTSSGKRVKKNGGLWSKLGDETVGQLRKISVGRARHVANYYTDLSRCYKEMFRVLKTDKRLCVVLGDTEYLGVRIPNTQVSVDLLKNIGFRIDRVIKRRLSAKIFTPFRDKAGRFSDKVHGNKRRVYQYEYIIVASRTKADRVKRK